MSVEKCPKCDDLQTHDIAKYGFDAWACGSWDSRQTGDGFHQSALCKAQARVKKLEQEVERLREANSGLASAALMPKGMVLVSRADLARVVGDIPERGDQMGCCYCGAERMEVPDGRWAIDHLDGCSWANLKAALGGDGDAEQDSL